METCPTQCEVARWQGGNNRPCHAQKTFTSRLAELPLTSTMGCQCCLPPLSPEVKISPAVEEVWHAPLGADIKNVRA